MILKNIQKAPYLAKLLLKQMTAYNENHSIIEDFEETFQEITQTDGVLKAKIWYWMSVLKSLPPFIQNLIVASIMIAFGLIIVMIFLEITGTKLGGEAVFAKHPRFFAAAIIILVILIFIGAGGLGLINIPTITITDPMIAIAFFLIIMAVAVWVMFRETGGK